MVRLETERLLLRPLEEKDLETFSAYRSDPQVARFQAWEVPYSPLNSRAFLHFMEAINPGTPGEWYQFAVALKETDQILGDLGLQVLKNDPHQAEFGITFARENQGKGYATEAVRALFDYAFRSLKMHRIFSRLDARNDASARLMERLEMRREAHFIQNAWFKGQWTDEYWYAILAEEWERIRPLPAAGEAS